MDCLMSHRKRALVLLLGAALAVLYQTENPYVCSIQETLVVNRNREDVFTAATSNEWIAKFLPFVDSVLRVDKNTLVAKDSLYLSRFAIPLYGTIENTYEVIDFTSGKLFRLFGSSPWLRPVLTVRSKQKATKTELTVVVTFWRNSLLFQMTLAPVLWLAHHDSLRQSLLLLRMDLQD